MVSKRSFNVMDTDLDRLAKETFSFVVKKDLFTEINHYNVCVRAGNLQKTFRQKIELLSDTKITDMFGQTLIQSNNNGIIKLLNEELKNTDKSDFLITVANHAPFSITNDNKATTKTLQDNGFDVILLEHFGFREIVINLFKKKNINLQFNPTDPQYGVIIYDDQGENIFIPNTKGWKKIISNEDYIKYY